MTTLELDFVNTESELHMYRVLQKSSITLRISRPRKRVIRATNMNKCEQKDILSISFAYVGFMTKEKRGP
jgi:hypothetical protein